MSLPGGAPHKTALRTFRLSWDLLVSLEEEARKQGITLNALLSSILTEHLEQKESKKLGLVVVPKPVFVSLLECADENALQDSLRKNAQSIWKSMMEYLFQDTSLSSAIRLTDLLIRKSSGVEMNVKIDGRLYSITFLHDYGLKYSQMLKYLVMEILSEYKVQPKADVLANSVSFQFSVQ